MRRPRQKFYEGDLVKIADDLGHGMDHFEKGCEAIVVYSKLHEIHHKYGLRIKGGRGGAWYKEHQLTLIKERQIDLYNEWLDEDWKNNQETRKAVISI